MNAYDKNNCVTSSLHSVLNRKLVIMIEHLIFNLAF